MKASHSFGVILRCSWDSRIDRPVYTCGPPLAQSTISVTNTNLSTGDFQVTGSEGQFIGIQRDSPDVRGITIGFTESFTIDDFTFSGATRTVPDTGATFVLLFVSLIGLTAVRRHYRFN